MAVDVVTLLKSMIEDILGDKHAAAQYASDPQGTLAAQGVTERDLSGVNMRQVVGDVCGSMDLPSDTRSALQSYSSGGGQSYRGYSAPSSSGHSVDQVMQHLNYVTYAT